MAQCLPTIIVNSLGRSFFEENTTATAGDILSGKVIIGKIGSLHQAGMRAVVQALACRMNMLEHIVE